MKNKSEVEAVHGTATQPARESERLSEQIRLVEIRQLALADELRAIDQHLDGLAGQEEVDEGAVAETLHRKQEIHAEVDFLTRRTLALQKKQAEAERAEAATRLGEITQEASQLAGEESLTLARFQETVRSLVEQAQGLVSLYLAHDELGREMVYLLERFDLPRPQFPYRGETPDLVGQLGIDVGAILGSIREGALNSPWVRKRQELSIARRQGGQSAAALPLGPERVKVIEARPDVRIPARPEDEGQRPNRMKQLLAS